MADNILILPQTFADKRGQRTDNYQSLRERLQASGVPSSVVTVSVINFSPNQTRYAGLHSSPQRTQRFFILPQTDADKNRHLFYRFAIGDRPLEFCLLWFCPLVFTTDTRGQIKFCSNVEILSATNSMPPCTVYLIPNSNPVLSCRSCQIKIFIHLPALMRIFLTIQPH